MTASTNSKRFRGSEFTQVEVIIYPRNPFGASESGRSVAKLLAGIPGTDVIRFTSERLHEEAPAVSSFSYSHMINTSSAACTIEIKARGTQGEALLDIIQPNDWIDVIMQRHEKKFHVFRGRLQGTAIRTTTGGGGATTNTLELSCRSFGYVLEQTQVYYDQVTESAKLPAAYLGVLLKQGIPLGVSQTIRALLTGFLTEGENNTGRSLWVLPESMPGVGTVGRSKPARFFKDALQFFPDKDARAIYNHPRRVHVASIVGNKPSMRGESLWSVLQRWNDGPLVDLYTDLVDGTTGRYLYEGQICSPKDTRMSVILRDKPFLTKSTPLYRVHRSGWLNEKTPEDTTGYLPLFNIDWKDISARTIARSDLARKNAFFVSPILTQDLTGTLMDLQAPLWDADDIQVHGFRPLFYHSPYMVDVSLSDPTNVKIPIEKNVGSIKDLLRTYRMRLMDFHCNGHLFLSGKIQLGHGRPDIRVGGKLRINSAGDQKMGTFQGEVLSGTYEENYHIDGVAHSWSPVTGMRTQLTVTRGLRATDKERVALLNDKRQKFRTVVATVEEPMSSLGPEAEPLTVVDIASGGTVT